MKIHINKNFDFLSEWLSELPLRFDVEGGKTLHDGRNVVRCFEEGGVRLVVKRFKLVNFIQQIAYTFFCRTKAEKAYRFARIFQERGFDTPAAVAYIEDYRWGLFRIGYFVSLYCENPPAFPALVPIEHYDEQLAQSLAELICRMHLKGILHGDLNFGNFLYRKMEDGRYTFTIIDTNRSRFMEHCPDEESCLYNLRTMTHRRDLFCYMVREYAKLREWNPDETEQKALHYLEKLELKHKRKEQWKKLKKH